MISCCKSVRQCFFSSRVSTDGIKCLKLLLKHRRCCVQKLFGQALKGYGHLQNVSDNTNWLRSSSLPSTSNYISAQPHTAAQKYNILASNDRLFVPLHFHSRERSPQMKLLFLGANVPRTLAPWNVRSRVNVPRTFVPWNFRSCGTFIFSEQIGYSKNFRSKR